MKICRVCRKNSNEAEIIDAKELFIGTRETFHYLLCQFCGSLSIQKIPSNLEQLYSKYPAFDFCPEKLGLLKRWARSSVILKQNIISSLFSKYLNSWEDLTFKSLHGIGLTKSSKILDVGCGNGTLIKQLSLFGFKNVTGIDPYIKTSSEKWGLRLLKKSIQEMTEKFNVVMFHHSFEHFADVHTLVQHLDKLTEAGGILVIRIPNVGSYSFKKYRQFWHGIHAPFHFFLPSLEGMALIFKETRFDLMECRYEQIPELFLYNINYSLDIALTEPLGVLTCLGDGSLGKKIPPFFTKKELSFLKKKSRDVLRSKKADYIAYYYRKKE